MAFNGITTACLRHEIESRALGGRIVRIVQPESDEIILTIKPEMTRGGGQVKLLLSADASLPLCCFTEESKQAPINAPAFCMLLRKHLGGGKIVSVTQPGLERVLRIEVEHLNEMGDLCRHTLVLELMGKYSNLIFLDDKEMIVDSIKHVSSLVSSVREVLPGRPYFIPETQNKKDALTETEAGLRALLTSELPPAALLVKTYTGFSNVTGEELIKRAGIDPDRSASALTDVEQNSLILAFHSLIQDINEAHFTPSVYISRKSDGSRAVPKEYSAFHLSIYSDAEEKQFDSMSSLISFYYAEKNRLTRIRQRTADLRHIVSVLIERDAHKLDLQMKQMKDTEKKEKYRIYGELLNTYGYGIPSGAKSAELDNYYTGEKMTVPLDPMLSAAANAQKYYDRYGKLKRTAAALTTLIEDTKAELEQLKNIQMSLDLSAEECDIAEIREELEQSGLIRRRIEKTSGKGRPGAKKPRLPKSVPFHYVSSDGYDIFVGKNNLQNDELTFHTANGGDIFFHANDIPGSHVILKTTGKKMEDIPDRTFEEAASLAGYYSSGRDQEKVEIDYLYRRDVKKPNGSKPGFVVYYTNYSIIASTDISSIRLL